MKLGPLLYGIATIIPGVNRLRRRRVGGGVSARYCYSVWLRHLVMVRRNGLASNPHVVAELGPGDSLGVGIAALLSGAHSYFAFDVVNYAGNAKNAGILDELVELFNRHEDIPGDDEFPAVAPRLDSYSFPSDFLTERQLVDALAPARVESIRQSLLLVNSVSGSQSKCDSCISYFAPWHDSQVLTENSVDMIFSQAVLEHVENLDLTYRTLYRWLKPAGMMSHTVDFQSHGVTHEWNGHWTYSKHVWNLVKGKRPFLLNRQPHSTHLSLMKETGFELMCDIRREELSGIARVQLAAEFSDLSDQDLVTRGAFFIAKKQT